MRWVSPGHDRISGLSPHYTWFPAWIIDDLRLALDFHDQFAKTLSLDGFIIVAGVAGINKERHQVLTGAGVHRTMIPARWDIKEFSWIQALYGPVTFRSFHNQLPFTFQAVIYLGCIQGVVEMTFGHEKFVAHL